MRRLILPAMTALALSSAAPALAEGNDAEAAIRSYCEPLLGGATAVSVRATAHGNGFRDETIAGQRMLRSGDLLVGLSDAPRVCFIQAPASMTMDEGMALADAWGARHPGAVRVPADRGPDGAPVRAWTLASRNLALIASHQPMSSGRSIMTFTLMPIPRQAAAAR